VSVALAPDQQPQYQVVGWLCHQRHAVNRSVELLVSGFTYDHNYWDLPYQPEQYSYVYSAVTAGRTVFNIDRIGVGQSSRPPADDVTVPSEAYVVHQVVQALRAGLVGGVAFSQIVGVGHSLGSAIWMYEASQYRDADALILTGYLHQMAPLPAGITDSFYPAATDPRFAGTAIPSGYVTTVPGAATRLMDFYDPAYADPIVARLDDRLAQTGTTGELATAFAAQDPVVSLAIRAPVLIVVGQEDSIFCAASLDLPCATSASVCARESRYYATSVPLASLVVPEAGHSINLHRHANRWFAAAEAWIDQLGRPDGRREVARTAESPRLQHDSCAVT
jgi:pimeloyl-ACP methyl ester carboxylesterase